MKLARMIEDFNFHCKYEKNLSLKTLQAYGIDLKQFQNHKDYINLNINSFDKYMLKEYIQFLYKQNFKAKTIKRKIAVLKAFFTYLEFEEILLVSPFRKIKIHIKEPKTLPKIVELQEIRKILNFLYRQKIKFQNKNLYQFKALVRDIVIIEILFTTGIRVSEASNIIKNDINIQTGIIKIKGKGNKERIIQICDKEVKKILKEYISIFKIQIEKSDFFLINRLGNKISEQSIRLMIKKYQKQVGLNKNITPHMFRHSFATLLLEEGVDIRYIQHMLGHSSISTTQIYTQVNLKQQKKILDKKHPRRNFSFMDE